MQAHSFLLAHFHVWVHSMAMSSIAQEILNDSKQFITDLSHVNFHTPVAFTYNPLEYAWSPYADYITKFAQTTKKHLFLGMNPGPYGMTQTGVPFGEIDAVKNWLHINNQVSIPSSMHPKRPIQGFDCPKSEVSGRRLWGLFADCFGTAEHFFQDNFVANFCPLVWMTETGANITPDKLPAQKRKQVDEICLKHLITLLDILQPHTLIGVGAYATKQLTTVATRLNRDYKIGTLLHPSPASPIANKNWPALPEKQLRELGIIPSPQ